MAFYLSGLKKTTCHPSWIICKLWDLSTYKFSRLSSSVLTNSKKWKRLSLSKKQKIYLTFFRRKNQRRSRRHLTNHNLRTILLWKPTNFQTSTRITSSPMKIISISKKERKTFCCSEKSIRLSHWNLDIKGQAMSTSLCLTKIREQVNLSVIQSTTKAMTVFTK